MTRRPIEKMKDLRWETYIWLVYSLPYLISSIIVPIGWREKILLLAAYAVFLVLYFLGYLIRDARVLLVVVGMDLLGLLSFYNPGAATFFIYGSAAISSGFSTRTAFRLLALQVLIGASVGYLFRAEWWFYMASVLISPLIGAITIQQRAKEAGDAKLRLAQEEVERLAKLAERERIARDMHDLLGHTLSVVVLKSELAQKLMSRDPAKAMQEMAEVERISRQGLSDVREAITGYRSTGLAAEIEHVRETLTAAGIDTTIEARQVKLAPAQESALTLALREAATNVIRHAGATKCHIKFYSQDGSALMEVQDDGRGTNAPFGNGLSGMSERVNALGGMLRRESEQGTRLMISLPL